MLGAHAVYSPSSSDRWIECTASASAIAALGEQMEGEEAKEGTRAHEELERVLSGGQFQNPAHPAAYGVALFVNYVKQLPHGKTWVEQRVRLTDQIWGRLDFAHYNESEQILTVVDLKNGYVGVDADASQFRIYAAAAILTFNLRVKWIRYAVVQPNDFRPHVPRIKQHIESAETLHAWATRVAAIPNGPLTFRSGEWCRYCPLFGKCDATTDVISHLGTLISHSPSEVRPDQVAQIMAARKCIEDWFKTLEKAQTKAAVATGNIPLGMALVAGQKHRVWKLGVTDAVREAIFAKHGLGAFDLPSPAQAEKLIDNVAELSERPEGGPVLAFESDNRPRWSRKSASEIFAELDAVLGSGK